MKKIRALIESVLLIGIAYLIYEIMFFVYNYLVYKGIMGGLSYIKTESYKHLSSYEEVAMYYVKDHPLEYTLLCWFVLAVIFLIVALPTGQKVSTLFNLRWLSIKNSLACIFMGLGLVFCINGSIRFIGKVTELEFDYLSVDTFNVYSLITLFIIVGLLTPIFEELFFRGIILGRLKLGFGAFLTIILSSVLFSISHLNVIQSIYVFPVGLLAAYLVIETGTVLSSIWLHIVYNMVNIYLAKIDFFRYNSVQLLVMIFLGLVMLAFGLHELDKNPVNKGIMV